MPDQRTYYYSFSPDLSDMAAPRLTLDEALERFIEELDKQSAAGHKLTTNDRIAAALRALIDSSDGAPFC